ncbi:MAG: hypothetical protein RJA44_1518 [Pseudomonadota bacterium]
MTAAAAAALIHAPLARWALERAEQIALDDGRTRLSFAALHAATSRRAAELQQQGAAATLLVDEDGATLPRLIEFLAIVQSGRCAAVGDPDWTAATRAAVRQTLAGLAQADAGVAAPPGDLAPFYIGYTSGSTGLPKGFRRHHRSWVESLRICLDTFGPDSAARILVPGRLSHSLFLFGMLLGLWSGGGVVLQERFSAAQALATLQQGDTPCLIAVPSQLVVMLERAARRQLAPIEGVRLILISGARWMRDRTPALQALFPQARIVEFYGASETSFIAWMDADPDAPAEVVGRPFANVELRISDRSCSDEPGLIHVRSPMLFIDYVGPTDASAALRDGDWLSVRDMGRLDAQGRLCMVGRQQRMIVTQGKNLFPEELEAVLAACPGVGGVSVHGVAHPLRGQEVVALLEPQAALPTAAQLSAWCRARLEGYKVPRHYWICPDWPLTASAKTDHARLGQRLRAHLEGTTDADMPIAEAAACLRPLP